MMDLFAQILDESWHGLNAEDSVSAMWHYEAIKELMAEYEVGFEANLIPEEMRVI